MLSWAFRGLAAVLVLTAAVGLAIVVLGHDGGQPRCGPGFVVDGARCMPPGLVDDASRAEIVRCPPPLALAGDSCDAPEASVLVPAATLFIGPSDWEAEGRVSARTISTAAFRLDAFEVTRGHYEGAKAAERFRAATGMTQAAARRYCESHGGRLPTEDEWIVAAAGSIAPTNPRRYPWGDTGAVCRRAAFGLESGPCAVGASAPDTVGAHSDGDSLLGIHDLAGNAAEWVGDAAVAKGGSWASSLATELRVWARLELRQESGDPRVGFRCAYEP